MIAAIGLALVWANFLTAGVPDPVDEYSVKAAFLYNFARFVEWPADAFETSKGTVSICVLGRDPFGHSLEGTVAGQQIEGRTLAVRHVSSVKQVAGCHVLFISSAGTTRGLATIREVNKPGILIVGESNTAIAEGAVINFTLEGTRVHFEISLEAAEREQLRISSKLLSLARVVGVVPKP
jgi:hypothetical protein